jgi:hypothetical protein
MQNKTLKSDHFYKKKMIFTLKYYNNHALKVKSLTLFFVHVCNICFNIYNKFILIYLLHVLFVFKIKIKN